MLASEHDIVLIGEACNGKEAIRLYKSTCPDVMLLDLKLPDMSGIEVIDQICENQPEAKIIVLTTYARDMQALRSIKAGARGYLLKATLRSNLLDSIRAVHAGNLQVPSEIATQLARYAADDLLTEREVEILKLVAIGCSNRSIGEHLHIAEYTVKDYLKSISSKLGADDRTHAVTIAVRRGYFDL